jgi:hypothetical protein
LTQIKPPAEASAAGGRKAALATWKQAAAVSVLDGPAEMTPGRRSGGRLFVQAVAAQWSPPGRPSGRSFAESNVEIYLSKLRVTVDASERDNILRLLIAEEDRMGRRPSTSTMASAESRMDVTAFADIGK